MGALALLEVTERDGHRDPQARHAVAVTGWPFTIGRALDNDLTLHDPHLAARHLVIEPIDGGLQLRAGDTLNGVQVGSRHLAAGDCWALPAASGPIDIELGRTRLRLRLPGHALPAELPLIARPHAVRSGLPLLIGAALLLALLTVITWLDNDPDSAGRAIGSVLLSAVSVAALWSGLWALLSKTFTRQGHFGWHLKVFSYAALAWLVVGAVPGALAFALSWPAVSDFGFIGTAAVAASAFYFHLLAVEPARPRLLKAVAVSAFCAGVALSLWFNLQRTDRFGDELYMSHLYPPALRLARPVPVDGFIDGLATLQSGLDRKAKEASTGEDGSGANEAD